MTSLAHRLHSQSVHTSVHTCAWSCLRPPKSFAYVANEQRPFSILRMHDGGEMKKHTPKSAAPEVSAHPEGPMNLNSPWQTTSKQLPGITDQNRGLAKRVQTFSSTSMLMLPSIFAPPDRHTHRESAVRRTGASCFQSSHWNLTDTAAARSLSTQQQS